VRWLNKISQDATRIFLVGDLFDFWFEYDKAIPKGHIRFLGKLAEIRDAGIPIELFTGNHDMWMFDYLKEELDVPIHRKAVERTLGGKKFLIGHGDGLGPGDKGYKRIKKVFAHPLSQWLFARIHPNLGIRIAEYWSGQSRASNHEADHFLGRDKEWLVQYCEKKLQENFYDYFIFGHRHIPIDLSLSNEKSRYLNLGEWMTHCSYAVFDGEELELKFFENAEGKIFHGGNSLSS
jgi:UDP-2,3-diacylglucosamine hydrolase